MHSERPLASVAFAFVLAAAGCAGGPDAVGTAQADIGITLPRAPDAVDCIAFTLANSDGTSQTYAFAMARSIKLPNITVGAYELSAIAYKSGLTGIVTDAQCGQTLPPSAPWTTEAAVPVTVTRNDNTQVMLTLIRAGTITVKSTFFDAPEVIASNQGAVGAMAAGPSGPFVAWAVHAPNSGDQIVRTFGSSPPLVLQSGFQNIGMLAFDPDFGTLYWEDGRSGATDADGHLVNDGSIYSVPAGPPTHGLLPADIAVAGANHTLYWGELTTDSIDCFGCAGPLATDEPSPVTMTAHGNRVFWHDAGDPTLPIRAMNIGDAGPQTLVSLAPFSAYGMTSDDDFVYWVDFDTTAGDLDASRIVKMPAGGGAPVVLVPSTLSTFPLVAYKGNVFYLDANGVHSVSSDGGDPVDVVTSSTVAGFAVTVDVNGHDAVYWTDKSHGGLVWHGRLD